MSNVLRAVDSVEEQRRALVRLAIDDTNYVSFDE